MPNWVDLIILIVLALFVWNGYHKGFIRQIGDFLILALSIVISFTFLSAVANFLASIIMSGVILTRNRLDCAHKRFLEIVLLFYSKS